MHAFTFYNLCIVLGNVDYYFDPDAKDRVQIHYKLLLIHPHVIHFKASGEGRLGRIAAVLTSNSQIQ